MASLLRQGNGPRPHLAQYHVMYKHGMSNHLLDGLAEKFPHRLGLAPQMALVCF